MRRWVLVLVALSVFAGGCGTILPGPRYRVTVQDFAFDSDSSGVFYLQSHSRFYPLLRRYRESRELYRYDLGSRRHRLIARTDSFSVSPSGPHVLYSPPWRERFERRAEVADFYLLDWKRGERRGFRMPDGFDDDYLSYGLRLVEWEEDGSLTAYVNFRYAPGAVPSDWKKRGESPPAWTTRLWKVRINAGSELVTAAPCAPDRIPPVTWEEAHRRKYLSGDGTKEIRFSKYRGYFDFDSRLDVVDREAGDNRSIVSENIIIGLAQAGKYIFCSVFYAPLNLLDAID